MRTYFSARWSMPLKITTAIFVVVILAVGLVGWDTPSPYIAGGVVLFTAFLSVRGYSVAENRLRIHRLGWSHSYDLSTLQDARAIPFATNGSLRVLGFGGVFSTVGYFRSSDLGNYVAYVTDSQNSVILDFRPKGENQQGSKRIVVTPDDPQEFLQAVHR